MLFHDLSLGNKHATNASCTSKVWGIGVTQRKRKFNCHAFPKELVLLKGSQFYHHIPFLTVWLVRHFLRLRLSVSHIDSLCQNVITDENILFAGWESSCPLPSRISSSHFKVAVLLHSSHQVSLVGTEYRSLVFWRISILIWGHNENLPAKEEIFSSHLLCKIIEACSVGWGQKDTFMPEYIHSHKFSHLHTHRHTHRGNYYPCGH